VKQLSISYSQSDIQKQYALDAVAKYIISRLQRILLPKMPHFVRQKVQISSKIVTKTGNSPIFAILKIRNFQQRILLAVNSFQEILQRLFDAFTM